MYLQRLLAAKQPKIKEKPLLLVSVKSQSEQLLAGVNEMKMRCKCAKERQNEIEEIGKIVVFGAFA